MKKIVILVLLVGSLLLAACSSSAADISLGVERFDFGDVTNGEVLFKDVEVENTGETDLKISSISTSCSCTTASIEPTVIPPGETGVLRIRFDSGAHGPDYTGAVTRQVYIQTNDTSEPEAIVEFTANILPRN